MCWSCFTHTHSLSHKARVCRPSYEWIKIANQAICVLLPVWKDILALVFKMSIYLGASFISELTSFQNLVVYLLVSVLMFLVFAVLKAGHKHVQACLLRINFWRILGNEGISWSSYLIPLLDYILLKDKKHRVYIGQFIILIAVPGKVHGWHMVAFWYLFITQIWEKEISEQWK